MTMTRSRPAGTGIDSPTKPSTRSTRQSAAIGVAGPSTLPETSSRTRRPTNSSSPVKRELKTKIEERPLLLKPISSDISPAPVPPVTPSPRLDKGKGKAVEQPKPTPAHPANPPSKRVLPARIRRAAGGGQDGIRDLEDMIVDWLDRYGYPSDSPPGKTRFIITSLPIDMVVAPIYTAGPSEVVDSVTITPQMQAQAQAGPGPSTSKAGAGVIETPDWVMVKAGQDDQEEAREEVSSRIHISPVRRLRRLSGSEDHGHGEDTSDEYYLRLHKRYEAIEKRQRKDEKDKLAFERYKMRTRIDLLRGMSTPGWSSVVWTVLAREDTTGRWEKGKGKVKVEGIEWLRRRLVREGEEVMKRYDQLLPVDPRKLIDSQFSTPTPSAMSRSASPPPAILPARVTALKDPNTALQRRRSLPLRLAPASSPRKRRRSDIAPQHTPIKRIIRITRQSQAEPQPTTAEDGLSDTDSDPLSDPPSESEDEGKGGLILPSRSLASMPSPSVISVSSSTSPAPVVGPRGQPTRASTRIVVERKPPARASARIRRSLGETPVQEQPMETEATGTGSEAVGSLSPAMSEAGAETESQSTLPIEIDMDDEPWSDDMDKDQPGSRQRPMIVDQVTLDEQLEMDRVEAAVVI